MLSVFLVKIKAVVFDFCMNKSLGRVEICTKRVSDDEKEGEEWVGSSCRHPPPPSTVKSNSKSNMAGRINNRSLKCKLVLIRRLAG